MRIGIDISQTAFPGTGVARYTERLVTSLLTYSPEDYVYTLFFSSFRQSPPKTLSKLAVGQHSIKHEKIPPTILSKIWNDAHIYPVEKFIGSQDLFISSDWTQPPTQSAKKLTIVHDLVPLLYPSTSTTRMRFSIKGFNITPNIVETHKKRLEHVKNEADHVVADSQSTKDDIIEHLGIPSEKITVVYPSVSIQKPPAVRIKKAKKKFGITRPFVLSVGKIEPRKNIGRLIEAFARSGLHTEMDLVVVGSHGWGRLKYRVLKDVRDTVRFTGYISDSYLASLYASAEFFMYPSLYEGFGYPAIEAMKLGCPVAASNVSSLAELTAEAGAQFDPHSIKDITRVLQELHAHKAMRKDLSRKGKKYSASFTDKKFARNMLKVFKHIEKKG